MTIDLTTTYRNFSPPLNADKRIRRRLGDITKNHPDIVACDVVGEETHGHQLLGKRYRIAIAVVLSDGAVVADHDHHNKHAPENFFAAVEGSFDALEQVLKGPEKKRAVAK